MNLKSKLLNPEIDANTHVCARTRECVFAGIGSTDLLAFNGVSVVVVSVISTTQSLPICFSANEKAFKWCLSGLIGEHNKRVRAHTGLPRGGATIMRLLDGT